MDQNMTTIITSAIVAVSTLLAGLGGVFLTNHHTEKLEMVKEKKEKRDRSRALLEELCSLCFQMESETATRLQIKDGMEKSPPLPLTLTEPVNRMTVIVNLYFPNLKNTFDAYRLSLYMLQEAFYVLYMVATRTHETPQSNPRELQDYKRQSDICKQKSLILIEEIAKLSQQY